MAPVRMLLGLVLLLMVVSGCAPSVIRLTWSRPPLLRLSPGQRVAVEVVKGGKVDRAVESLRVELAGQMRNMGFQGVDKVANAEVVVRMAPTAWSYQQEPAGRGRLDVTVDVLDSRSTTGQVVFHDGYWAAPDSAEQLGESEVMVRAAGLVVERFLEDLRPQQVSSKVEMDDSDPIVGPGLELCRNNQFEAAYLALAQALNKKPNSAAALYDLGVMAEVRGSYEEAEDLLKRATEISPKPIYVAALERVRSARADNAGVQKR